MKKFSKKQQGFTILELMLVVGIIGILSSIALTAYKDYLAKTKWGKAIYGVRALKLALETCLVDNAGKLDQCDSLQDERIVANGISAWATGTATDDFSLIALQPGTAAIEITGNAPLGYCTLKITPSLPVGTGLIVWSYIMSSGDPSVDVDRCKSFVRGSTGS
jgi:type IV pilus assembly protein PilA